jgi:hypothetical protein
MVCPMDSKGAEVLRKYLEERNGGQVPNTARAEIDGLEGAAAATLERWFKSRDELTQPSTTEHRRDDA